jgi:hypothetical protein
LLWVAGYGQEGSRFKKAEGENMMGETSSICGTIQGSTESHPTNEVRSGLAHFDHA